MYIKGGGRESGYEGQEVPGYWLWHPVDRLSAGLSGDLGPGGVAHGGCSIHIREAMQYDRYGGKYPVDTKLKVVYVGCDGWAMGKVLPLIGPVMMLRIGSVENVLPALFAQKEDLSSLEYARDMNPDLPSPATQQGHDKAVFERRLDGYRASDRPYKVQQYENASFM